MITRQHIYSILVACLFLLILAACGNATRATPATELATPQATPIRETPITLFFWHAWPSPEQETLALLVDRYNQSQPLVQIILQAKPLVSLTSELRATALAGGGPHLVLLKSHTLGTLVQDGLLLQLDTLVTARDREQLLPIVLASAQVQNEQDEPSLYGVPLTYDTLALYYNEANIDIPPADTATLLSNARGLTDATTRPPVWGLAYNLSLDKTIGYLYAFGGRIFDDDGTLVLGSAGRAGTERWLAWLTELRQDQQILAINDSITIDNALKAQEALMTIDWAHALPDYAALWKDNLGVAMLPRLSATSRNPRPYVQSDVIGVNARVVDRAEQQALLDFLRYLLDDAAQQAVLDAGKQPAARSLTIDGDTPYYRAARVFRKQSVQAQAMPNSLLANEVVREELERMQLKVLRGLETPAEAVTSADTALRQRLGLPAAP